MYYIAFMALIGIIFAHMTGFWIAVPFFLLLSVIPATFILFAIILGIGFVTLV